MITGGADYHQPRTTFIGSSNIMRLSNELQVLLSSLQYSGDPQITLDPTLYPEVNKWFDLCQGCDFFGVPPITHNGIYPNCIGVVDGTYRASFTIDIQTD